MISSYDISSILLDPKILKDNDYSILLVVETKFHQEFLIDKFLKQKEKEKNLLVVKTGLTIIKSEEKM